MSTFTVTLSGVIVAVEPTFEEAEATARNWGHEALIECPNGVTLEFVMGWYRQVGSRSDLFKVAQKLTGPQSEDEIEMLRRQVG